MKKPKLSSQQKKLYILSKYSVIIINLLIIITLNDINAQNYTNNYNPANDQPAVYSPNNVNNTLLNYSWTNFELPYKFVDVYYEKIFFDDTRLLKNSNGLGGKLMLPITKGFFIEVGGSYAKADPEDDVNTQEFQTVYGSNADPTDFSVDVVRANIGLGVSFYLLRNLHIIAKGGLYYSDFKADNSDTDLTDTLNDISDGVGFYIGPEVRLLLAQQLELNVEAIYSKVEEEGQLSFGAGAIFYPVKYFGIGANVKIIEDDAQIGVGGRFFWD